MVSDKELSSQLLQVNTELVNKILDRLSEVLDEINTTLETSSELDKKKLLDLEHLKKELNEVKEELEEVKDDLNKGALTSTQVLSITQNLLNDRLYSEEDRDKIILFSRKFCSAVTRWTEEERNAVLDLAEDFGSVLVKLKKKLNRMYWVIGSAGTLIILNQVGAPDWVQKLIKLFIGG